MRINPGDHVESPKSIEQCFMESMGDFRHLPDNRNMSGDPLFTKSEVLASKDELTQLLRAICIKKGLTKQFVTETYRQYASDILQEAPSKISTGAGNLLSAVKRDPVSFKTFIKLFACVLGYDVDLTIGLRDANGKVETFNYLKTLDDIINSEDV